MATRTKTKAKKTVKKAPPVVTEVVNVYPPEPKNSKGKYLTAALAVVLLVVLFWYKTGSWPIVAVVNYRPIFRFQLNDMMYQQIGPQTLDSLVIEQLIKDDIAAKRITVADAEIDAKISEIKASLGSDEAFQQALAAQGLDETRLREQVKIQLGLEKLVADGATDSGEIQTKIYDYLTNIKNGKKVWTIVPTQEE
jgi:foldase protein PrsA